MSLSQWFEQQLQTSMDNFLWAVELIPQERLYQKPRADRWPIARLIYHLGKYEQRIALPSMQQWLGGEKPVVGTPEEDGAQEERDWNNGEGHEVADLIEQFREVRGQQIALIAQFTEAQWHEERGVIWSSRPLKWVVTKTYQHTLEHTDETLRAYLWWK